MKGSCLSVTMPKRMHVWPMSACIYCHGRFTEIAVMVPLQRQSRPM
jgi:hypothetical protein